MCIIYIYGQTYPVSVADITSRHEILKKYEEFEKYDSLSNSVSLSRAVTVKAKAEVQIILLSYFCLLVRLVIRYRLFHTPLEGIYLYYIVFEF